MTKKKICDALKSIGVMYVVLDEADGKLLIDFIYPSKCGLAATITMTNDDFKDGGL